MGRDDPAQLGFKTASLIRFVTISHTRNPGDHAGLVGPNGALTLGVLRMILGDNDGYMAVHQSLVSMASEAIEEHLAVAEYCVSTVKPGSGGVYGFTAVLLLFSVVDALSNYLKYPRNSLGALRVLDPQLSGAQVKSLKDWFRNPSSHQAMIVPGTKLTLEEGDPFEFAGGEPSHIRVRPFFRLVSKAWKQFDRNKITAAFHPKEYPHTPISFTGASTAAPIAPSGCYIPTTPPLKGSKK